MISFSYNFIIFVLSVCILVLFLVNKRFKAQLCDLKKELLVEQERKEKIFEERHTKVLKNRKYIVDRCADNVIKEIKESYEKNNLQIKIKILTLFERFHTAEEITTFRKILDK